MNSLCGRKWWRLTILASALALVRIGIVSGQGGTDAKSTDGASKQAVTKSGSHDYGSPQIRRINEEIRRVWEDNKLHPSVAATDNEWCRRVYLDVLGRVPSV